MEERDVIIVAIGRVGQEKIVGLDTENLIVTTEANQYKAKTITLATGGTMQKLGVPR